MTHKVSTIFAGLLAVLFLALVYVGWLYYEENGHYAARHIEVKIPPGATLREVQSVLVDRGLLDQPRLFRWVAWISGKEKKIKSGRYLIREGESVSSMLGKLSRGEVDYTQVIVPEGFMVKEIAELLQRAVDVDSAAFYELVYDSAFVADLGFDAPSLEGYLYPDTYLFSWPLTAREAAERMVHRFREVYASEIQTIADSLGYSLNEVVTIASIIQAEAVWNSEMPHISAVYHNRLRRGWRLEADPTVAYALGGVRRRLYYKDLRIDSPYNTYRRKGLPPGAICSTGLVALLAAVQPLEGCQDLYFVANGGGRHHFSKTLAEHLKVKREVRANKRNIPLTEPGIPEETVTWEDSLSMLDLPPIGGAIQKATSSSGD
jgi:UPF0755 protein